VTDEHEEIRKLARREGMAALEKCNAELGQPTTPTLSYYHSTLKGIANTLILLIEENDDLLEGYLKAAGEAAAMEDKLDVARDKHKRAEHACARMGAKLSAQRSTLLEAVAAAAGRKELT
jgi:hypothetical protein